MTKIHFGLTISLFALACAAGLSKPALAADMEDPNCRKGVELKVSGQINRAVLYADDGTEDDVFFVDNDTSSSRVRWTAKGHINCEWTVGANFEVEWESNASSGVTIGQAGTINNGFKERKIEVWFAGPLGKISLGQGDTASNGTSEVDLSKTGVANSSATADVAGSILFRTSAGVLTAVEISDAFSNFDGNSRQDRVRYDTPTFAGFKLSVSTTDDEDWDAALRFSKKFGDVKVAAAVGYVNFDKTSSTKDQLGGSVSVLFPFGANLTFAYAERDTDNGNDPHTLYAKLGWILNVTDLGPTAVSVDYARTDDLRAKGDEFTTYSAAIVQHIPHVGTEIYGLVRNHEAKLTGIGDTDDIFAAMFGARVKF